MTKVFMVALLPVVLLAAQPVGMEWQVEVKDNRTSEVKTFKSSEPIAISLGSTSCRFTPLPASEMELAGGQSVAQTAVLECSTNKGANMMNVLSGLCVSVASPPTDPVVRAAIGNQGGNLAATIANSSGKNSWSINAKCLR